MKKILAATLLTGMFAMPAFAQDMKCSDFTAMDATARTDAMASMETIMKPATADETTDAGSDGVADTKPAAGSDSGAMAEGTMKPATGDKPATADETTDPGSDANTGDSKMMAETLAKACADNPDMMVSEAMSMEKK